MNFNPVLPVPFACLFLCLLGGCKTHLDPVSYSPDYTAITRADGRIELVPQACAQPAAQDDIDVGEDFQALLPPGCASNLILLQMVEQRADVLRGRDTGPTMAAPVGRAAQVYIDGYDREELRRRQAEQQASTDTREAR
ncbi:MULTISPECIES: hypothetical protein [Pseudomonas syringae group]|uniref:Uncharacterized protein n=1 Tax=Pseudomonas syringae pv. primulae TaxID=251707 RepID=A0A0P9YKW4_9PSED|nr:MULTISPECIES: hypothetical protein [Pseudomonas syringae group]KPY35806.1 Uncharacterized protein ALO52_00714 [Pseudomonas syringae pv. primulae]MBD8203682.1 hypothetical protein [Pseudomonas viridiflava]MEE4087696.1 hypothetical protein [Pseudomonas viridiflava]TKJ68982.1 hypothetical protein PviCFBP13507_01090 [Pseudomonas viridiflava]TKK24893.1 hypothetical protein PviCFBP13515_18395 [Pseudomonas viridiflava]